MNAGKQLRSVVSGASIMTYLQENDGRERRVDVHELREVGHEPAGNEIFNHELDETGGSLQALEPGTREASDTAAEHTDVYAARSPSVSGRGGHATRPRAPEAEKPQRSYVPRQKVR